MVALVALTVPGLVILLTAVMVVDQIALRASRTSWIPWRGSGREGQVSSTGFEQLHLVFSAGKQHELDERKSSLMLRDDEGDGAPPRTRVDLDGGEAIVRLPGAAR